MRTDDDICKVCHAYYPLSYYSVGEPFLQGKEGMRVSKTGVGGEGVSAEMSRLVQDYESPREPSISVTVRSTVTLVPTLPGLHTI